MPTEERSHNSSRTTVDDVVFAITLSIFAAALAVLVASALTEESAPITMATGAQQSSQQAGTC